MRKSFLKRMAAIIEHDPIHQSMAFYDCSSLVYVLSDHGCFDCLKDHCRLAVPYISYHDNDAIMEATVLKFLDAALEDASKKNKPVGPIVDSTPIWTKAMKQRTIPILGEYSDDDNEYRTIQMPSGYYFVPSTPFAVLSGSKKHGAIGLFMDGTRIYKLNAHSVYA